MYLSRLILNLRSRQVRAELANPYEMHRTIMKGFPDGIRDTDRVLYRLETRPQQPYLTVLVQSRSLPDFQSLHETGYLCQPAETKSFDLRLEVGQAYTFRLVANPTRKIQDPNNENGKRVGIYKEEEQLGWLQVGHRARRSPLDGAYGRGRAPGCRRSGTPCCPLGGAALGRQL